MLSRTGRVLSGTGRIFSRSGHVYSTAGQSHLKIDQECLHIDHAPSMSGSRVFVDWSEYKAGRHSQNALGQPKNSRYRRKKFLRRGTKRHSPMLNRIRRIELLADVAETRPYHRPDRASWG